MRVFALLFALLFSLPCTALSSFDQRMLAAGTPYFPLVIWAHEVGWPDAPMRSFVAAQAEKESRWNPKAELCVPRPSCQRERGIGLGQFTITQKFNAFHEVSRLHPELKGWRPEEYTDPRKQLLAMVVKNKLHYRQCSAIMRGLHEVMACVASSYNGGHGGVLQDRRLCSNTLGCDPFKWFGHVESTSLKAKTPLTGYGQSFFQINRSYARGLVLEFRAKYVPHLGS